MANEFNYIAQIKSGLIDTTCEDYVRLLDNDDSDFCRLYGYGDCDMFIKNKRTNRVLALAEVKHHNVSLSSYRDRRSLWELSDEANQFNLPGFLWITYTKNDEDETSNRFGDREIAQVRPKLVSIDRAYLYVCPINAAAKRVCVDSGFATDILSGRVCKKRELTLLWRACETKEPQNFVDYDTITIAKHTKKLTSDEINYIKSLCI